MIERKIATVSGLVLPDAPPVPDHQGEVLRQLAHRKFWQRQLALTGLAPIGGADRAAHWVELMTPQTTEAFYIGFSDEGRRASMIPQVYGGFSSSRAFEEFAGVGQFGSEGWNLEQAGRVQRDERRKGFPSRFTHVEFAKGFWVQRKMIDDNQTQLVLDDARELGDSAFRKREKGAASVFNNSFTDTGTNQDGLPISGPDGVGLCSTAHPRSQEDSTTQSNEGTLDLTEDNLSATRIGMQKITDDRGDLMDVMADQLLVPPEKEDQALKLTKSVQEPGSANNAINPQNGRFQTVVWHYLSAPGAWWLMDAARRRRALRWYDRIPLEFGPPAGTLDRDTYQVNFDAYMRYSYGWIDWSWIFGQNGT